MKENEILKAADDYVFVKNGHRWSNNNNECADNFGSFVAGARWAIEKANIRYQRFIIIVVLTVIFLLTSIGLFGQGLEIEKITRTNKGTVLDTYINGEYYMASDTGYTQLSLQRLQFAKNCDRILGKLEIEHKLLQDSLRVREEFWSERDARNQESIMLLKNQKELDDIYITGLESNNKEEIQRNKDLNADLNKARSGKGWLFGGGAVLGSLLTYLILM